VRKRAKEGGREINSDNIMGTLRNRKKETEIDIRERKRRT
jgi:hypothetical protein